MDDNKSNKPQRRIVLPERKTRVDLEMSIDDISVNTILSDALQTAAIEIAKYRTKVGRGNHLDGSEARIVQGWIKCMLEVSKEHREAARSADLGKLSDEEMILLAKKVLNSDSSVIEQDQKNDEQED